MIREPAHALSIADLRRVRLFIAQPCDEGQATKTIAATHELTAMLSLFKIQWRLQIPDGETVARARNRLTADFMAADYTHLMFIDSDIQFLPESVIDMIRLNVGLCGGLYPKKQLDWVAVVRAVENWGIQHDHRIACPAEAAAEAGLQYAFNALGTAHATLRSAIEVAEIGTGFMLIARRVIERMQRAYPQLAYADDYPQTYDRRTYALFEYGLFSMPKAARTRGAPIRHYLSEDYLFCQRWRAIGGRVWAWPHAPLSHIGQFTYEGDFRRRLKPQSSTHIKKEK
jgi:hypothetical protein